MGFIPNLQALKRISDIHIDSLFISQAGNQIFNCSAEGLSELAEVCETFKHSLDTLINAAHQLKTMLPQPQSK